MKREQDRALAAAAAALPAGERRRGLAGPLLAWARAEAAAKGRRPRSLLSVGCRIAGGACVPPLPAAKLARVARWAARELRFEAAFDAFEGDVDPLWLAQKERCTVRAVEKARERWAARQ